MPSSPETKILPRPQPDVGTWIEVRVSSEDATALEPVAILFDRLGRGGAVLEETPESGAFLLKTYLPDDEAGVTAQVEVEIGLALLRRAYPSLGEPSFRRLDPADWTEAWKRGYRTQHIGRSLVIVPSWEAYTPRPGEHVLHLDPGMAFGTGLHETTRLCLELLEEYLTPGCRVLDLGTGSGILAIAAALLGADAVLALDADPQAVRVAEENVRRNRVEGRIHVRQATLLGGEGGEWEPPVLPLEEAGGPFHLAVVNILADVIVGLLRAGLAGWLVGGGALIASGIVAEQVGEVARAAQEAGLEVAERRTSGSWAALVGRRRLTA